MTQTQEHGGDINALVPRPSVLKVSGEVLCLRALPVKRLVEVVRFVEDNSGILSVFERFGKSKEEGGSPISDILVGDLAPKLNEFIRLLFDQEDARKLTDDFCFSHLSSAHYVAIVQTAIRQNKLDGLFQKAKELMGASMDVSLRQKMEEARTKSLSL